MYPILFEWGPVIIPSWHFMYALGAVLAFLLLGRLNLRLDSPFNNKQLSNLFIIGYLCGYFGARFLSIGIEQPEFHSAGGIIKGLFQLGPMTFYGGAIGTFLGGLTYAKVAKLSLRDILDISIPCGLVALAVGRVGCFLNGAMGCDLSKPRRQSSPLSCSALGNSRSTYHRLPTSYEF